MSDNIRNNTRNDVRIDNRRTEDTTAPTTVAKATPAATTPAKQPDLSERADINKMLGNDASSSRPALPATAGALDYGALTGLPPGRLGIGEAGTPSPAEMKALQTTQRAVVDAGVAMFAVSKGMDIKDIAERFDSSVAELEKLNPGLAQQLKDTVGKFAADHNVAVPVGASDVSAVPPAADPATVKTYGARYGSPSPSLEQVKAGSATMARGMGGESVKELQQRLNKMGANLDVDGKFGPKTEAALKAFQSANGIQQTGVLGKQTFGSLDGAAPKPIAPESNSGGTGGTSGTNGPTSTTPAGNLTGSAFGQQIAAAGERSARRLNSVGRCALGVNDALVSLGVQGRGHAYQKAEQLANNPRFREVNVSANDLRSLPPGAVVVWGRSDAKPYGHVSIALGGGREASDHIQNQITGGRYGTDFGRGPDPQGRQFRVFMPN